MMSPNGMTEKKVKHLIGRKIVNDIYLDVKSPGGQNVVTPRTSAPVKVHGTTIFFGFQNCVQGEPRIRVIVTEKPPVLRATHELAGVKKNKTHWGSNQGFPMGRHL